jgi:hypothetical protein
MALQRINTAKVPRTAFQISTQSVPETQRSRQQTPITLPDLQPPEADLCQDLYDYNPEASIIDPALAVSAMSVLAVEDIPNPEPG